MTRIFAFFYIVFIIAAPIKAQESKTILLSNPSFEDYNRQGQPPRFWSDCGFRNQTPPDVQPGFFKVYQKANHGNTYLGLVVRDNDTWETVGQRLPEPLMQDECYSLSLDLCRSETYISKSQTTLKEENFTVPAKIRIWGGYGTCDKKELLGETEPINSTKWTRHKIKLTPKEGSYQYLMIEVYYKTPVLFPYNGHVLVDNASAITSVPCKKKKPTKPETTKPDTKPTKKVKPPTDPVPQPQPKPTPTPAPQPQVLDRKTLKKGQTIKLEKIFFDADQATLTAKSDTSLQEILLFLQNNNDVTIEIGGHTNLQAEPNFALKLSQERAKAVADWLVERGIPSDRVQYKGYGKSMPIDRTASGKAKNQRVEIKILSIKEE